ncbi:MAG TPA: arsenate reductase (glutaredoxin) [Bacteroidales bacterium]|nr:arsenate reductase (glutaredoxin) [Bacteroidales bacterium]
MMTIYHNPRCKKSRAGLQALETYTKSFEIKEYLTKNPFTVESLTTILIKLKKKPEEIIRKQEDYFKSQLKGKSFSHEEWIKIMIENPNLIQRPIVVKDHSAVIGDPIENIEKLF